MVAVPRTHLAEIREPEAAAQRVEHQVVGALQRHAVAVRVQHLDRAGLEVDRLDARIDEIDAEVREFVGRETREQEAAEAEAYMTALGLY